MFPKELIYSAVFCPVEVRALSLFTRLLLGDHAFSLPLCSPSQPSKGREFALDRMMPSLLLPVSFVCLFIQESFLCSLSPVTPFIFPLFCHLAGERWSDGKSYCRGWCVFAQSALLQGTEVTQMVLLPLDLGSNPCSTHFLLCDLGHAISPLSPSVFLSVRWG